MDHPVNTPQKIKIDGGRLTWVCDSGKRHRLDGPAFERPSVYRIWFHDGVCHRVGGPAIETPDGRVEYRVNGGSVEV